jgi:hypothetical protein
VLQPWQDKMHLSQKGKRALFSAVTVGTGNTVWEFVPAEKGNWSELWLKGGK